MLAVVLVKAWVDPCSQFNRCEAVTKQQKCFSIAPITWDLKRNQSPFRPEFNIPLHHLMTFTRLEGKDILNSHIYRSAAQEGCTTERPGRQNLPGVFLSPDLNESYVVMLWMYMERHSPNHGSSTWQPRTT